VCEENRVGILRKHFGRAQRLLNLEIILGTSKKNPIKKPSRAVTSPKHTIGVRPGEDGKPGGVNGRQSQKKSR